MYSVGDIKSYQNLPEFPSTLAIKGTSKNQEVMDHFIKLRQEMLFKTPGQVLLKGWITRKDFKD
jgi:hypothetical protein